MNRRMLAIVMATAAAALFVLVAVYTWATAAALGAQPLNGRFLLSALPVIAAPLVGAELLRHHRRVAGAAVLGTSAVVFLPVPASSLLLIVDGGAGVWTASALLELGAYGALATAAIVAVQQLDGTPTRRPLDGPPALLAVAALAGSVWAPVGLGAATAGQGWRSWLLPMAVTAVEPGQAAVLALAGVTTAVVLYVGLTTAPSIGTVVLAAAAAVLMTDHLANLLRAAADPDLLVLPAGWAGLVGTLGLLFLAVRRLRDGDGTPADAALVAEPDAV